MDYDPMPPNQERKLNAYCSPGNRLSLNCAFRVLVSLGMVILLSMGMIMFTQVLLESAEQGQQLVNVELLAVPVMYGSIAAALSVVGLLPYITSQAEFPLLSRDKGVLGFLLNFLVQTFVVSGLFVAINLGMNAARERYLSFV